MATHYPSFHDACWHEGSISNKEWLPWFTCKAMGDMLLALAEEHPDRQILVLCGHTHSRGKVDILPNFKIIETTSISQVVFYVIQMGFGDFSGGNDISWATAAS